MSGHCLLNLACNDAQVCSPYIVTSYSVCCVKGAVGICQVLQFRS